MEIHCKSCQRTIRYTDDVPQFCSHCGKPLEISRSSTEAALEHTHTFQSDPAMGPDTSVPPAQIGHYRLIREIGRGGMGVVYEAEQEDTGLRVAVKILPARFHQTRESVERFKREGQIAASISHPRSTFIYAAGQEQGQFYIAMELMTGGTVKDIVQQQGKLPVARAVDHMLDVIDGLQAAHRVGIIHRDIKPSNCFLDVDGRVKIGDYGLSKSFISDASLTQTGSFMGTPQFAAPEQVKAGKVDERTDIYAIGCTLYYLLAAEAPFTGDVAKVIAAIASEGPPSIRRIRNDVPRDLQRIISQALEKDPARRQQTLIEIREALLPFASQGATIAALGRRLAAYFLDTTAMGFVAGFLSALGVMLFLLLGSATASLSGEIAGQRSLILVAGGIQLFAMIAYFVLAEGVWGRGLGKAMMGLRVVDSNGESPGMVRALVRAVFLPGLVVLTASLLPLIFGVWDFSGGSDNAGSWNYVFRILQAQLFTFAGWAVSLLCFLTMKANNGYRGVHEFLSGTRVVRLGGVLSANRVPDIPVTLPSNERKTLALGEFHIEGTFGNSNGGAIHLASDQALSRPVWVAEDCFAQSLPARVSVTRPGRLRWLKADQTNGHHWTALEAVRGGPLIDILLQGTRNSWPPFRSLLHDLAIELAHAVQDGTLPSELTVGSVWVDENSRIKLLDFALASAAGNEPPFAGDDGQRAVNLLQSVLKLVVDHISVPGHVLRFQRELKEMPRDRGTLQWASRQLQAFADRSSSWRWDDRLGVMAISFGTELTFYYTSTVFLACLLAALFGLSLELRLLGTGLTMFGVAALLGWLFDGGPVFRLADIGVHRLDGRAASKVRATIRCVLSWSMAICGFSMFGAWLSDTFMTPNGATGEFLGGTMATTFVSVAWFLPIVLHFVGGIISIVSPKRGVQDWLARTCIIPK